jgi:hypothetical protein
VGEKRRAGEFLRSGTWTVPDDEPHRGALASEARYRTVLLTDIDRITAEEYETALAVAAGHTARRG